MTKELELIGRLLAEADLLVKIKGRAEQASDVLLLREAAATLAKTQEGVVVDGAPSEQPAIDLERHRYPTPYQEGYSDDGGDTWLESPDDAAFVNGLAVGDTYELQVCHYSVSRTYRVTKAPDEESDDYEVEPVALIDGAKGGVS